MNKKKFIPAICLVCFLSGCLTVGFDRIDDLVSSDAKDNAAKKDNQSASPKTNDELSLQTLDDSIVRNCTEGGGSAAVIKSSRDFINNEKTVTGSCWDYLNAVYNDAGYDATKRKTIFTGKSEGPYCDPSVIQAGDWVMFNNLGYQGVGHSGLFIQWIDYETRTAIVVDHPGLNKTSSGRYRIYDISELFGVVRAAD